MLEVLAGAALRSLCLAAAVGAGLRLRRTHNPHVSLAAWTLVLVVSLAMPVAMWLTSTAVPDGIIPVRQLVQFDASPATSPADPASAHLSWPEIASLLWLGVFTALMLRLLSGLALSWRITRAAAPIREDWAGGFDVRASRHIDVPATFGSVILLPRDHAAWTPVRRLAVLAHEGAHIARRDFAIQLGACIHRAVFWFNPFSWWLRRRLSDLAEAASDDAAIAVLNDRFGYAEVLLEISGRVSRLPGAVAMARRGSVAWRIERILSETSRAKGMSRRGRAMLAASIVPPAVLLSLLIILPPPRLPSPAGAPSAVAVVADQGAAEGVRQATQSHPHAAIEPPPPISKEATVPAVPPPASAPRIEVAAPPPPSTLSQPRSAAAPEASRPNVTRPVARNTLATEPSAATRQANRTASKQKGLDRSQRPALVGAVAVSAYRALGPDPTTGAAAEDSRSPLFKRLLNETCMGTFVAGKGGTPMPYYYSPVRARFYSGPGDAPWVSFAFAKQKPAELPVTIAGGKIEFTASDGTAYSLLPASGMLLPVRYQRFTGAADHAFRGMIDVACGKVEPPRVRPVAR